jgi:hypothetical protein
LTTLKNFPEIAAALGEMVIAWANAEIGLIGALTRVSGSDNLNQMQRAYYHLPTFDTRIKYIRSLIPYWKTSTFDKDAIDKCVERIGKLAAARNHWIHADWCVDTELRRPITFNHRTSAPEAHKTVVRAHDILNHVEAVRSRNQELQTLVDMDDLIG